jgi:dihydroorotase
MEFALAAPGICGLETSLSLALTTLLATGKLSLLEVLRRMALNPALILKIPKGTLAPGMDADVLLFDPEKERMVKAAEFASQSDNTPFDGWKVKGEVAATLVAGNVVYVNQGYEGRFK